MRLIMLMFFMVFPCYAEGHTGIVLGLDDMELCRKVYLAVESSDDELMKADGHRIKWAIDHQETIADEASIAKLVEGMESLEGGIQDKDAPWYWMRFEKVNARTIRLNLDLGCGLAGPGCYYDVTIDGDNLTPGEAEGWYIK